MPQASWVGRNGALTFRCNIICSISWFRWLSLSTGCLTTPKRKESNFAAAPPLCFDASEVQKFNLGLPLASNRRCAGSPMCALAYLHQCNCIYAPMLLYLAPIQLYLCTNSIVFVHQCNCICAPMLFYLCTNSIIFVHQCDCICAPMILYLCTNSIAFVHQCNCIYAPL